MSRLLARQGGIPHKLAVIGLCVSGLALAGDEPTQKIQISNTEHIDFPPNGALRLTNSIGELTVEGWDRSDVEITTIRSTKLAYDPQQREKATHDLDKVRVAAERHGDELVITTDFPRHRTFPPPSPLGSAASFRLEYDIKVPRNARLMVDHDVGDVHVENITGDIHVTAHQGEIVLHLPEKGLYSIDAKSDFGNVISDFPGHQKRTAWRIGHQFTQNTPGASQKLSMRIRYGDIIIFQIRRPPTPAPVTH